MHHLLTFCNAVVRNSGAFLIYPFSFLTLEQQYKCSFSGEEGDFAQCTLSEICANKDAATPNFVFEVD